MKDLLKSFGLAIAFTLAIIIVTAVLCQAQVKVDTPEYFALTGTQPRQSEAPGCEYSPINKVFPEPRHFSAEYITIKNEFKSKIVIQDVDFLFVNKTISLSQYPISDPKSQIVVMGIIKSDRLPVDGEYYTVDVFQAKDRSNAKLAVTVLYNKDTTDVGIELCYANSSYIYHVKNSPIPEEPYFILDHLENKSIHDKFGGSYSNEEVYEFLSQFGAPKVVLNFMLREMFYNQDMGVNNKPQKWQKQ